MTERTWTVEPWSDDGDVVLANPSGEATLVESEDAEVFWAAVAVLAPDAPVRELIERVIKDAYYRARDHGGTMHTAAENARDAVLDALFKHVTGGDRR